MSLPDVQGLMAQSSRAIVTDAVRAAVDRARAEPSRRPGDNEGWLALIRDELASREQASLRPVFNATGVILHTNLGRAPLARASSLPAARPTRISLSLANAILSQAPSLKPSMGM